MPGASPRPALTLVSDTVVKDFTHATRNRPFQRRDIPCPLMPPSAWSPLLNRCEGQHWPTRRLPVVNRILLTGMSGTGKSSVVRALAARGYKAIDTDDGWCEPLPDGRQRWREDAIQALLDTDDTEVLFVAGCEDNQVKFHPQFDHIILLSAPHDALMERLAARTSNSYGTAPAELSRVLEDVKTVEPLLRQVADAEVRTTAPLNDVVAAILHLVGA